MDAAPKAAAVQAQHEQELRKLLTQAQEDIEKHRKLAAAAQRDKQGVLDQVSHHCTVLHTSPKIITASTHIWYHHPVQRNVPEGLVIARTACKVVAAQPSKPWPDCKLE